MQTINYQKLDRELKKDSAELLTLSLLEARSRHGYEVRKLIENARTVC
jgi:PadR family transcriptional regulator, regulatory protein PadR